MALNINISGKNPYTGLLSKFSPQFQQFVKDLGDAKSKSEEDRIVHREAAFLKEAIHKAGVTPKQQKEHIVRLIYCDMLGADVSFSHMEAVKFAQQQNLLEKRVAYSAICLFLDEKNGAECMMMNTGSIQRDLKSTNILEVCFGLLAASKVVIKDMLPAVLPLVKELMKHKREVVRKKAVMTMFKFYEIECGNDENDYMSVFQGILCDKDPAVMGVSLNAFHKFILKDSAPYKILVASFVSILKQIVEKKLPSEFNFKGIPAPWMQIKLLQILALLGSEDSAMSKMMYEILRQCLEVVDTEQGIGCAVAYECMKTIAMVYPNRALVEVAAAKAALFLLSDIYNLKYLGINALSDFINVDMSYGTRHQMVIIECLTDDDDSIKRKTLELLYRMTNGSNVKFICGRLIVYLKSTVDEYVKSDLVLRITTLAEKYAPDNEWFIETMNEVFELGGDLVPVKVAYNMMAIIGEGIGDDDNDCDDATEDLRRYAVMSYISILSKPVIPDILIQLACWVLGEYFDLIEDYQAEDISAKLFLLLHRRFTDPLTQSWVISAIMKIVCRADEPTKLIQDIDMSLLTHDAQQTYREMKATIRVCNNLDDIFPYDASCEDIKVDIKLSFLNDFVAKAIENGSDVYSRDKWHSKKSENGDDHGDSGKLRFHEYDEPVYRFQKKEPELPSPATQRKPKEKCIPPQDVNKGKGVWTKCGYSGKNSKEESSNSEVSTPASSESSSVKTEEDVINVNKFVEEKTDEGIPSPTKLIKEEMAKQLFTATPSVPMPHRKRKGVSPRKPKISKSEIAKETDNDVVDLLLILDPDGESAGATLEGMKIDSPHISQENTGNDSIIDITVPGTMEPSGDNLGIRDGITGTGTGIYSPQTNSLCVTDSMNEMFNMMEINKLPQTKTLEVNNSIPSNVISSNTEETLTLLNLMDDEVYEPHTDRGSVFHQETESSSVLDTSITIPEELNEFKYSPNPIELCSNNHLRVTCQYVYQPAELTIVFFLLNQSPHTLSEIQFVIKLPSNLKSINVPIDFHSKELGSMASCSHSVSVGYSSPALHMVLSGNIKYRDLTNTEKKMFLNNHVLPVSSLIRPLDISVDDFGGKWRDRSLKDKKEKKMGVNLNNVNELIDRVQENNFHTIEIIGNEVILAGSMLNKDEILLHLKLSQLECEISIKSGSTLLNDSLMKMLLMVIAR